MKHLPVIAMAVILLAGCVRREEPVQGDGTVSSICDNTPDYDTYFTGERLRLDLVLSGDANSQSVSLMELHREDFWSGSRNSLVDHFGYGQYFLEAFSGSNLIFSRGFCSLFEEWRTTEQAGRVRMAATQCLWMPFPKDSIHIVLYERIRETGRFSALAEFDVDPADTHITAGRENDFHLTALQYKGDPSAKVDLVFAGEGYMATEMAKLREDSRRMMEYMFTMEPYASRREDFNIWLVESPSPESGVDLPRDSTWRNTLMDAMFDTFYTDRYLTIMNHRKIATAVSGAPFDAIFVVANETKYGGGGMYGSYAMGTSDNERSLPVFIHEFGHSFAGLGDEYYDSETAYDDNYYPLDVEPWEPNITTLVDFGAKWEDMMGQETENGTVGTYEGAGYLSKGCYRPFEDCRMFHNDAPGFCPVCQRAINRMIDFYTK